LTNATINGFGDSDPIPWEHHSDARFAPSALNIPAMIPLVNVAGTLVKN